MHSFSDGTGLSNWIPVSRIKLHDGTRGSLMRVWTLAAWSTLPLRSRRLDATLRSAKRVSQEYKKSRCSRSEAPFFSNRTVYISVPGYSIPYICILISNFNILLIVCFLVNCRTVDYRTRVKRGETSADIWGEIWTSIPGLVCGSSSQFSSPWGPRATRTAHQTTPQAPLGPRSRS